LPPFLAEVPPKLADFFGFGAHPKPAELDEIRPKSVAEVKLRVIKEFLQFWWKKTLLCTAVSTQSHPNSGRNLRFSSFTTKTIRFQFLSCLLM
jgi:hypothetical protein